MNVVICRIGLYHILAIIMAIILSFILSEQITFQEFVNNLFLISLIYLIIGGFMFIARGGFFDAITISFRKVLNRLSKKRAVLKDELDTMALPSELFKQQSTLFILITGSSLFVVTMILSII